MAEIINNVLTQNTYQPGLQLGPAAGVQVITFSILGQPAILQFWTPIPGYPGKQVLESIERTYTANTFGAFATNVSGVRFRSAIPGSPAQIHAEMAFAADPKVIGGTLAGVAVTASGQIVLPGAVLTGIIAQNGSIVAGTGFSVAKGTAGLYNVTFSVPFSALPVVTATSGYRLFAASYSLLTVNGFQGQVTDTTALVFSDAPWSFTVTPVQ